MHIAELLALNAREYPNADAVITLSSRHSWHQLHQEALQLAAHLQSRYGIERGDRVALVMPMAIPGCWGISQ